MLDEWQIEELFLITVAGPRRTYTGFPFMPLRAPGMKREYHVGWRQERRLKTVGVENGDERDLRTRGGSRARRLVVRANAEVEGQLLVGAPVFMQKGATPSVDRSG